MHSPPHDDMFLVTAISHHYSRYHRVDFGSSRWRIQHCVPFES